MKYIKLFILYLRSIIINLRLFPFNKAVLCPILVGKNTVIIGAKRTNLFIDSDIAFGIIRIGCYEGSFKLGGGKTIVQLKDNSRITFKGSCIISKGCKIIINERASIEFGDCTFLNANTIVNSGSSIVIGHHFLAGWNVCIIDGDGHDIIDIKTMKTINSYRPIKIGNHCWASAHSTILKGVALADNTIIPYGSIISKSSDEENCIFGGNPNKILKKQIKRHE